MTERLESTDQVFIPVIFDEDETEFIMKPIIEVGYHFDDIDADIPVLAEGQILEVSDGVMAAFVAGCLTYWSNLAERRIATHFTARELDHKYNRPRLTLSQQENMRNSIESSSQTIQKATELIGRLSLSSSIKE